MVATDPQSMKRERKVVPPNPTGYPIEQSCIGIGDELTPESSSPRTSLRGLAAWPKTGRGKPGHSFGDPECTAKVPRRTVRSYVQRQIGCRNGVTLPCLSSVPGVGVNRRAAESGMVSEAKAPGKARRYADGDPATRKI